MPSPLLSDIADLRQNMENLTVLVADGGSSGLYPNDTSVCVQEALHKLEALFVFQLICKAQAALLQLVWMYKAQEALARETLKGTAEELRECWICLQECTFAAHNHQPTLTSLKHLRIDSFIYCHTLLPTRIAH